MALDDYRMSEVPSPLIVARKGNPENPTNERFI